MAAKIENQLATKIEMIPSSGGVFEIVVDKKLIYSKKATGAFPLEQAILDILSGNELHNS